MFGPLLDAYAMADLQQMSAANLVHHCEVQSTADGLSWSTIVGAADEPCRLSRPQPSDGRTVGDTAVSAVSHWVLALAAGSEYAAARLRFVVTGSEHGQEFSRTLYSIGALTPLAQTAEARVLCSETPLAVADY